MRSMVLAALVVLMASPLAAAEATPEERALVAFLGGGASRAARLLADAAKADPVLRWVAGRVSLAAKDLTSARRLFEGGDAASAWARIDVLEASGDLDGASAAAIAEMDRALKGEHRTTLCRRLVARAADMSNRAPDRAAAILEAVLTLPMPDDLRAEAENALFRVSPTPSAAATGAARRRLAVSIDDLPARRVVGHSFARSHPALAFGHLDAVARRGERVDAVAAAKAIVSLDVPLPLRCQAIDALASRFPADPDVANARLDAARRVAEADEAAGSAALEALAGDPRVGGAAQEAWAAAASDPGERRQRWLKVSSREGASARGEKARKEAAAALRLAVSSLPEGEARRAAALRALEAPDGAGDPGLMYAAVADGPGWLDAVRDLAARFPGDGPWCGALATRLVRDGATVPDAETYATSCARHPSEEAVALRAFQAGDEHLLLLPVEGGVDVLASGTGTLRISEHRVDADALYSATTGHPLETSMDAFLMESPLRYEVDVPRERLRRIPLRPRAGGPLSALQVRAGDRQATALVSPSPLQVQAVIHADSVAVAVLSRGAPVAGADVRVDAAGKILRTRTDGAGVAVLTGLSGEVRVMARRGDALGFLAAGEAAEPPDRGDRFTLVIEDRALPAEGASGRVHVFGWKAGGTVNGGVRVRSLAPNGDPIEEADVALAGGAAEVRLLLLGGGRVEAVRGRDVVASAEVDVARTGGAGVAIELTPATPVVGDRLRILVSDTRPPAASARAATLRVTSPWRTDASDTVLRPGTPHEAVVDLSVAAPGDLVSIQVESGGERTMARVRIASADAPPAPEAVPSVAPLRTPIAVRTAPDAWTVATSRDRAQFAVWAAPGQPLALPAPGLWDVSAWRHGARSAPVPVRVPASTEAVGPGGAWNGPGAVLVASTSDRVVQARVVRPGESLLPRPAAAATRISWLSTALARPGPLPAARPAEALPSIAGSLERGRTAPVAIGADLPAGTRLWAFVRDASDAPERAAAPSIDEDDEDAPGSPGGTWSAEPVVGERIADALLAEEERLSEEKEVERLVMGGATGYGAGGGGAAFGARAGRGVARSAVITDEATVLRGKPFAKKAIVQRDLRFQGPAIAVLRDGRPGNLDVTVGPSVTQVQVLCVARLPDGRWTSAVRHLPVGGPAPIEPAVAPAPAVPETWDGRPATLADVAATLPPGARAQALAPLARAGVPGTTALLRAALARTQGGSGPAIAARAADLRAAPVTTGALRRLEGLPDSRHAERATGALEGAGEDPARAVAAARRLLAEPGLDPWIRAKAALALWIGGETDEALAAAKGPESTLAAVRALAGGRLDRDAGPALWTTARSEAAAPADRALALQALATVIGTPVRALPPPATDATIEIAVLPPIAEVAGDLFRRGASSSSRSGIGTLPRVERVPARRTFPVEVVVPPSPLPTRLACPSTGGVRSDVPWLDLPPAWEPRRVECTVRAEAGTQAARIAVGWHAPDGTLLAGASTTLDIDAARDSQPADPMSPDEQVALGSVLARSGDAQGLALLRTLLESDWLAGEAVSIASTSLLEGTRQFGDLGPALLRAFEACRERSPRAELDLALAADVARAYRATGNHRRAVAATRVVADARFREELDVIARLQRSNQRMVAIRALQDLLARYPEVPSVVRARYLVPSILLELASGSEDREGVTRSSLRHTAAAELARFLLLHPAATQAPEAATLLLDAVRTLRDPAREQALARPLADRYRAEPGAWRLLLADAEARYAQGRFDEAARTLEDLATREAADPETVRLLLGRVYEAQGRTDLAKKAFDEAGSLPEASARTAWLGRDSLELPPLIVLRDSDPKVLDARLRPGTEVRLSAYRVSLENLLLRDDGEWKPDEVRVDGLAPEESGRVSVDARGDIPLPSLAPGGYLLAVSTGPATVRTVLVRTDAEIAVTAGPLGGALVHLFDDDGRPVPSAQLWYFSGGTYGGATRTDVQGTIFLESDPSSMKVLARTGRGYAWWGEQDAGRVTSGSAAQAPAPARAAPDILRKNQMEFDDLLIEGQMQQINASDL